MVHRCAAGAQGAQQAIGDDAIIFGNQDAHACLRLGMVGRQRLPACRSQGAF
jgi:hypothetical protein